MRLEFLGTGAGVPSKERNVSSLLLDLNQEKGETWLFDCGEATQHQILKTTIKPRKVAKIFITHLHGDHIYGLPGFLSSRSFQDGTSPVMIYGPKGLESFIKTSLAISGTHLRYPFDVIEVNEGIIFEDDTMTVYAQPLEHGIPSFGYRVEEKDKPGELLPEKLRALGIHPGPIYKQIKENETTILPDGEVVQRKDVIGDDKRGHVISILGDTRYLPNLQAFVKDSDVLIHEATFAHEDATLAYDYFHSTTTQAATLASAANVNKLILTHISSRYTGERIEQLRLEAATIFPNVTIAHDLYQHEITK